MMLDEIDQVVERATAVRHRRPVCDPDHARRETACPGDIDAAEFRMRAERWRRVMACDRDEMVPAQTMGSEQSRIMQSALFRRSVAEDVLFSRDVMSCIPASFTQGAATSV